MKSAASNRSRRRPATSLPTGEKRAGDALLCKPRLPWLLLLPLVAVVGLCTVLEFPRFLFSSDRASWRATTSDRSARAGGDLPASPPSVAWTDVTAAAGIALVHRNGAAGEKLLPETMGGGSAFFDYDSDGDQDLLFVDSVLPGGDASRSSLTHSSLTLYRNDGQGRFDDATAGSGLEVAICGMGIAVGDYDNDDRIDVFVSAVGPNKLFRNLGAGRFEEVTSQAGVGGAADAWSTGCGWFDADNDGDLDLLVCNYLAWSPELDRSHDFRFPDGRRAYGRPQHFAGASPYFYRNDGRGRFSDLSKVSGLDVRDARGAAAAKSLGVTFDDFDRDGRLDILVANDTVPNQAFRNSGHGTFEEQGLLVGIALDERGLARGAMGIDSAPLMNDDRLGIAIGNFAHEMASLFVSRGAGNQFQDWAATSGLGAQTERQLTFGMCFVDFDLDGRLDLLASNGHLEPDIHSVQRDQEYLQAPQLFWNAGAEARQLFLEVPALPGPDTGTSTGRTNSDLAKPLAGRGASYADIDGDGDLDLLITAVGSRPRLLRNELNQPHHWVRFQLVGRQSNRSAIGATVEVRVADRTLRRRVMPTRSYLSQVELPLTFGLGNAETIDSIIVHWPDGSQESSSNLAVDRVYRLEQGELANLRAAPSTDGPPK